MSRKPAGDGGDDKKAKVAQSLGEGEEDLAAMEEERIKALMSGMSEADGAGVSQAVIVSPLPQSSARCLATDKRTHTHAHTHTYTYTRIHTYTHTHIHIHIHIHIYTHALDRLHACLATRGSCLSGLG